MKRSFILTAAFLLLACEGQEADTSNITPQDIGDGPFGTYMNMPQSEFASLRELDFNYYKTYGVPRNSAAFEFYEVSFSENGLCMLRAVGNDIETTAGGTQAKFEFERIEAALNKKYGATDDFRDEDTSDAEAKPPLSWMKRLADGTKIHEKYWWSDEDTDFPSNIKSVSLRLKALDEDTGYVALRYEFDNYDACEAMEKAAELDNL